MKEYHELQKDMLGRVVDYEELHPLPPAMARGTALFTKVGTLEAAMTNHAGGQLLGLGGYRAGATERKLLISYLRTVLLDMSATARGLETEHPGITDQFRLGRQAKSDQQLLATAQAFLLAVETAPMKLLFTERSFAADFDVQLTAKIAAVTAAVSRKATGRQGQKHGTASLTALSREINATMRELRPLIGEIPAGDGPDAAPGVERSGTGLPRPYSGRDAR